VLLIDITGDSRKRVVIEFIVVYSIIQKFGHKGFSCLVFFQLIFKPEDEIDLYWLMCCASAQKRCCKSCCIMIRMNNA